MPNYSGGRQDSNTQCHYVPRGCSGNTPPVTNNDTKPPPTTTDLSQEDIKAILTKAIAYLLANASSPSAPATPTVTPPVTPAAS